jgi:hypothetical protein
VLRAWLECERVEGFRARIPATTDVEGGGLAVFAAGTPDAVITILADWLEEFLHGATPP